MPHDEDRVFDVSKPHKVSPPPTSKPVIVGHHPQTVDPMVTDRPAAPEHHSQSSSAVNITVHDGESGLDSQSEQGGVPLMDHHSDDKVPFLVPAADQPEEPAKAAEPSDAPAAIYPTSPEPAAPEHVPLATSETPSAPEMPVEHPPTHESAPVPPAFMPEMDDLPLPHHHGDHNGGEHQPHDSHRLNQPKHGRDNGKMLWVLAILVLLVGAYVALDATTSAMPFHIFKKTTPATTATTTPPAATTTPPTTPANPYTGWKSATLSAEKMNFKYPSDWTFTNNSQAKTNLDSNGKSYGDNALLTSPSGFRVTITAGQLPATDTANLNVDQTDKITFVKQPAGLNLLETGKTNTGTISLITLTDEKGNLFAAKNVPVVSGRQSNNEYVQVVADYGTTSDGSLNTQTLSYVSSNSSYKALKLIIESMGY